MHTQTFNAEPPNKTKASAREHYVKVAAEAILISVYNGAKIEKSDREGFDYQLVHESPGRYPVYFCTDVHDEVLRLREEDVQLTNRSGFIPAYFNRL